MAVKMIGLDLDGTLIGKDRSISARDRDALIKAAEQGVHIVPVTGRPISGLPETLKEIKIDCTITSNGATVCHNGETVITHHFPGETCAELLRRFDDRYSIAEIFIGGMGYEDERSYRNTAAQYEFTPIMEYFKKSRRVAADIYALLAVSEVEELAVMCETTEQCDELLDELKAFPMLKAARPMPCYLEIMASDGGKGTALNELAESFGIERSEIMAVGDSDNDADMLMKAGIPVAMGNAADSLKRIALFVTEDNAHGGVAAAVEKFVLFAEENA